MTHNASRGSRAATAANSAVSEVSQSTSRLPYMCVLTSGTGA